MNKPIKVKEDFYIEFSDEELASIGLKKNDKLTVELDENTGNIKLVPFGKIDINLSDFSRETLEYLISESVEKDISVNEVIEDVLTKSIERYEKK